MKKNKQIDIINIKVHDDAIILAREHVNNYATLLLLEAKNLAYKQKADMVLRMHVDAALRKVTEGKQDAWRRELSIILGSLFLGAFLPGFISEIISGNPINVVNTVIGFIGLWLIFWGLKQ